RWTGLFDYEHHVDSLFCFGRLRSLWSASDNHNHRTPFLEVHEPILQRAEQVSLPSFSNRNERVDQSTG
ncbi:MAG: hypothetical protein RR384_03030, partial [Acidaminococcaceae bacterium]